MSDPKPHEKSICANCGTEIEWASRRPEEGWEYDWYHLPIPVGQRVGDRRCPAYATPKGCAGLIKDGYWRGLKCGLRHGHEGECRITPEQPPAEET